jgi:DNA-binding NarL/FixJ family response regulator
MAIRDDFDEPTATQLGVPPSLTPRESIVLELVAEGFSTRQIAETLGVSEQAITYHVGNLLSKFTCENRAGLVGRAFIFGYLHPRTWPPRLIRA